MQNDEFARNIQKLTPALKKTLEDKFKGRPMDRSTMDEVKEFIASYLNEIMYYNPNFTFPREADVVVRVHPVTHELLVSFNRKI